MRAFIVRIFLVVVFFIGLGALAEKVNLFLYPEKTEVLKIAEIRTPDLKVVKLEGPNKIVVHGFRIENPEDFRIKIGPRFPFSIKQKPEPVEDEKVQ